MHSTTYAARKRGHLSRHERQQLARAEAFSRRTPTNMPTTVPVKLEPEERELIAQLVRRDRTAVSSALLAVAGIGASEPVRHAVLDRVTKATYRAQAEGVIGERRSAQIARHVKLAVERGAARRSWSLAV